MNYREHTHADDRDIEIVTCGNCGRSWCEACDPAPAALCVFCHGRGTSDAAVPPRQARREP